MWANILYVDPKIDIDFWGNWQVVPDRFSRGQRRRRPSLIKALRDMFLRWALPLYPPHGGGQGEDTVKSKNAPTTS